VRPLVPRPADPPHAPVVRPFRVPGVAPRLQRHARRGALPLQLLAQRRRRGPARAPPTAPPPPPTSFALRVPLPYQAPTHPPPTDPPHSVETIRKWTKAKVDESARKWTSGVPRGARLNAARDAGVDAARGGARLLEAPPCDPPGPCAGPVRSRGGPMQQRGGPRQRPFCRDCSRAPKHTRADARAPSRLSPSRPPRGSRLTRARAAQLPGGDRG
jgi:hypothetical protein